MLDAARPRPNNSCMILQPDKRDPWSGEIYEDVPADVGRRVNISPAETNTQRPTELNSAEDWVALVREILATANSGGGRLELRCIPNGASADARHEALTFTAPITAMAPPKATPPQINGGGAASETLKPVRIVTDPDAPALQPPDVDHLYPWRQKDLLRELNGQLGRRFLNSYDIQAVRRQHHLDDRPDFVFNLPGAGRRYSSAVAEWMMLEHARDPEFFHRARTADHEIMRLRRHKPQ
jgi:hypothetical protein